MEDGKPNGSCYDPQHEQLPTQQQQHCSATLVTTDSEKAWREKVLQGSTTEGELHKMTASTDSSPPTGGDTARSQPTDRITVALIPKAAEDLQRLQDRTKLSKTDIANRAISLYEFINSQEQEGRQLLLRDTKTGETELVRIL